jgi:DNA-binding transcriptional MerR regulator
VLPIDRDYKACPHGSLGSSVCPFNNEGHQSGPKHRDSFVYRLRKSLDPGTRSTLEDIPVRSKVSANLPMHSSELARMAGVSTDTLRYYERLRLLPAAPRSASGYRLFPAQALNRVRLIRGALAIGFSVRELAAIFAERDRGGVPCHRVRELAREKLAVVETSLRELQVWRRELKTTLAGSDRLLGKTPRGQRAGLLESFVASHPTRQRRYSALMPLAGGHQKREKSQ